jgi:hypothetical protein
MESNWKSGDTVTLTFKGWDKKKCYFICIVREYLDHRDNKKFQFMATERVNPLKKISIPSRIIFELIDVQEIEKL